VTRRQALTTQRTRQARELTRRPIASGQHPELQHNRAKGAQAPQVAGQAPVSRPSLARQALSGLVGFGLISAAYALAPRLGPAAYLLGLPGFLALGGCPTCWVKTLVATLSAGRLKRNCANGVCSLETRQSAVKITSGEPT